MFERIRLADALHAGFTAGHDGLRDDPALVQRGWDMWADFGSGQLYDQARGQALTTSGAFVWASTPQGGSIDWNASATNANLTFPAYPPPARFTVAVRIVIGTLQSENVCTWQELADSNTFDRQIRVTATNKLNWYSFGGANFDSAATFTTGQLVHAVCVFDGSAQLLYIDGRLDTSAATGSSGYGGFSANSGIKLGYKTGAGGYASSTHKILSFGVAPVAYDAGQVFELWQRPSGQVAPRRRVRPHVATSGPITGSAAITLGALTSSGTGTLSITGTGARTLAALTSTGTGTLAIAGTAAPTLAALTSTGSGTLSITGSGAVTLGALASSGTATLDITGTAAATLDDLTSASVEAPAAATGGRLRRYRRQIIWEDPPPELAPVVSLAQNYADDLAVERAVDAAIAKMNAMSARASMARRARVVEEVKAVILDAIERAAEQDDEEALIALL